MRWAAAALLMAVACAAAPAYGKFLYDIGPVRGMPDAAWCAAHQHDGRIAWLSCDPFRSKADPKLPMPVVSYHLPRDLNAAEETAMCVRPSQDRYGTALHCTPSPMGVGGDGLLPNGMAHARLAIRTHLVTWTFPATVVRIGVSAEGNGRVSVDAPRDGASPYFHQDFAMTGPEVDRLLAALRQSHFWQLPHLGGHPGGTDGPLASIEVSLPGRRHYVTDSFGPPGAADLSILTRAITTIVSAHWKGI